MKTLQDRDKHSKEITLWRAVIEVAIIDACSAVRGSAKTENARRIDRQRARDWLLSNSKDFLDVCEYAGVVPDAIRRRANELHESGWPRQTAHRYLFE